jgi:hypothetical protein
MLDALSSATPVALNVAQTPAPALPQDPPAGQANAAHIDVNAPAYISPAITFNPETSVVIITYRNAETGKVTEQIPPPEVTSRYNAVQDTGQQSPALPLSTGASAAAKPAAAAGGTSTPTPAQPTPPQAITPPTVALGDSGASANTIA